MMKISYWLIFQQKNGILALVLDLIFLELVFGTLAFDMVVNHCQVSRGILQLPTFGTSVFDSSVFLRYCYFWVILTFVEGTLTWL